MVCRRYTSVAVSPDAALVSGEVSIASSGYLGLKTYQVVCRKNND